MALIRQAESLVEESTEGIEEGDTAPGSKKALQARIDQAYYIMNNTSRDEGYRNACKQLEEAIKPSGRTSSRPESPISTPGRR